MTPERSRRSWRRAFITWGALGAVMQAATPALALDCDQIRAELKARQADPPSRVKTLLTDQCLGGAEDKNDLARKIRNEVLKDGRTSANGEAGAATQDERVEHVLRSFDLLDEALSKEFKDAPEAAREAIASLDAMIRSSRQMVKAVGACVPKSKVAPELAPSHFTVDAGTLQISQPPQVALMKVLGPACGAGSKSECSAELARAEALARAATLAESSLIFYSACFFDAADEYATFLDRKWTTYFEDARSQYPWELAFNGWRMDRNDTREVSNGNRMGFLSPPSYQWILVHPSVALEYVDDAPDGQQFKPAVLVEVFGYNGWKYETDGSMGSAWGVSAVALLADRGDVRDLGYGLMMHVQNTYSIGVTRHDSDTGFVVSGDVSDLWLKVSQKWRARLPAR